MKEKRDGGFAGNPQPNKDTEEVRRVYDKEARSFAEQAPSLLSWEYVVKPFIERVIKDLCPQGIGEKTIGDFGAGSGRVFKLLLGELGIDPKRYIGIELSEEEVKIAEDRYGKIGARFIQGDITDPKIIQQAFQELGGEKIDIALCIMVIEFLNDEQLKKFLENVKSILSDEGALIVVTTHPDRYKNKYGLRKEGPVRTQHPWGGEPFTNFYRKPETLEEIFKAAGFEVSLIDLNMPEEYTREFGGEFNTYGAPARLGILAKKPKS